MGHYLSELKDGGRESEPAKPSSLKRVVLRQPVTAYRDAEGWVLMDSKGDPTDWPTDWPKEINRRFLKSKGVMPVPGGTHV